MIGKTVSLILLLVVLGATAQAILPPDASAREPQLRAYRQRMREQYEARQLERQAAASQAYRQTRAAIFTPPWMRTSSGTAAVIKGPEAERVLQQQANEKRNHRIFVSVVLLILIVAAAGWAHYATRELDE